MDSIAQQCLQQGGSSSLVFNAANEVAVDAFLRNQIGFNEISNIIESTLNITSFTVANTLDELLSQNKEASELASAFLRKSA